ncbi:MAG: uroporphyrinogen-III synthase [Paracoccaceae bacterium]|jgi:uroporphyrinogen-III synthase
MLEQSKSPIFVVTRPNPQAERFGADLAARFGQGAEVIFSPLIAPRFFPVKWPKQSFEGVVFTSQTGVQAFEQIAARARLSKSPQAWCVGDQTAEAAERLGFESHSAGGDGQDLVDLILRKRGRAPLIHLRGADQRGSLAQTLCNCGTKTTALVIYAQEPQPFSEAACIAFLGKGRVFLPLFSPRSAKIAVQEYLKLQDPGPVVVAALSLAVALECGAFGAARLQMAARPDVQSLLDTLVDLVAEKDQA